MAIALMMGSLYQAPKESGASDERAKAAAEEVAGCERDIADLRSTQRVHTWILSVNTALLIAILLRVFWA